MKNLTIRNLSKTYFDLYAGTNVTAVHDVSLDVQQGEFVSIVGPSGCGKSTILNMIAGFIPHTGGEILLDGRPVNGPGPDRGVVFQDYALFPWLNVKQNVAFGPSLCGLRRDEQDSRARGDRNRRVRGDRIGRRVRQMEDLRRGIDDAETDRDQRVAAANDDA